MDEAHPRAVRDDWLHCLSEEVQRAIGVIEFQEYEFGAFSTARHLVASIPDPLTSIEERLLRGMLLELSVWWAEKAHRRAHRGDVGSCSFRAEAQVHDAWVRSGTPRPSKKVFGDWATAYFRALHCAHPAPAEQAAGWIVDHSRERVTLRLIARAVGVHPVVLRRGFKACFGLSVHSYLQRTRLADTMRLLASGTHNVRSALYTAGWSSPKSLYHAATYVSGMSVHELRALSRAELDHALELPTPHACGDARRRAASPVRPRV